MIDKLLLNNQIITNKKKIQQARIQTINKLVQKIRKLKNLNEKHPNNAKIKENLEKTPKIMASAKKIKVVDIIRKILTLSKKPTAILTNGQSLADDIAVALLATNKILAAFIDNLKTLLNLDENNPGWQNEIMELSKRKKKLLQNGDRKKVKKLQKSKKQQIVRKLPWKEENLENSDIVKADDNVDPAPAKGWKVEAVGDASESLTTSVKPKPVKKDKSNDVLRKETSYEKVDQIPAQITQKPVTTVDSFFFTESGDNYLSTVVIDRVQPDGPDDGLVRRERRDNTMRPNQRYKNIRRQSEPISRFEKKKHPVQNGRIDKRHSFAPQPIPKTAIDEKLHPSWAAKQKQKPIIAEFKGQKITFGDGDAKDTKVKSNNKPSQKQNHQNKPVTSNSVEDNIHPSWAAKQKQKPAITEFKGTKITFDD